MTLVLGSTGLNPALMHKAIPTQVQDLVLWFVDLHQICAGPSLQPVEVSLNGSTTVWCLSHSSQVCIVALAERAVCPIVQVINGDVKQYLLWYEPLGSTSSDWPIRLVWSDFPVSPCWLFAVNYFVTWNPSLLNKFGNGFQGWGDTDQSVVPWILFLALLEDRSFHYSGTSFDSHDFSKIIENGLAMTLASSLSTHYGCILWRKRCIQTVKKEQLSECI